MSHIGKNDFFSISGFHLGCHLGYIKMLNDIQSGTTSRARTAKQELVKKNTLELNPRSSQM